MNTQTCLEFRWWVGCVLSKTILLDGTQSQMVAFQPEIRNKGHRVTRDQLFRRENFPPPSLVASSPKSRTWLRVGRKGRAHSTRNLDKISIIYPLRAKRVKS
jgi:hypothetical protein